MRKVRLVVLGAGSRGMDMYASFAEDFKDKMELVAVADLDHDKVKMFSQLHNIPEEMCFYSADELFEQPKLGDGILICTQDRQHCEHTLKALEKGYHILLEKPIATTPEKCKLILDASRKHKRHVMVCHVLRYTVFYQTVKKMIDSGKIGDVVSIQASEGVAFWHQAHSYVRGNWRNSNTSGPMILTKSCHDMDLLSWLMNKKCVSVSSYGDLHYFRKENAPEGAALRCLDGCKVKEQCPYDAEKIYVTGKLGVRNNTGHPVNILNIKPTEENIYEALKTGPYGRCVFHCDNNVVDHQVVNCKFEDGSTASFTMCAFDSGRDIKVMGTLGKIYTQDFGSVITMAEFSTEEDKYESVDIRDLTDDFSGHGGGDKRLLEDYLNLLLIDDYKSLSMTSIDKSLESHFMAFAAEQSRLNDGAPILIDY